MPTVPLVALKPHRYDGRVVRKGQTFNACSDQDAIVLTLGGFAVAAPSSPFVPELPDEDDLGPTIAPADTAAYKSGPAVLAEDLSPIEPEPEPAPPAPDPTPAAPQPTDAAVAPRRPRYRRKDLVADGE